MEGNVNVAIIGAGQAGLATSWYLKQAGIDHVVLEANQTASCTATSSFITSSGGLTVLTRPYVRAAT
jgi:glycine/D-amino acid oxidase-like deaminating enzyme